MAKQPKVKIEGSEVDKVLTVSYGIMNHADADGRPTKNRYSTGITITRIADGNKDVAAWAERTAKETRKGGEIEFFYNDGTTMKTLKWDEAYVQDYSVRYDLHQDHVVERFVIMPRMLDLGGTAVDYEWETHH